MSETPKNGKRAVSTLSPDMDIINDINTLKNVNSNNKKIVLVGKSNEDCMYGKAQHN